MTTSELGAAHSAAFAARRTLLRRQAELLVDRLAWLSDPNKIPPAVLVTSGTSVSPDPSKLCFLLARWMVTEVVTGAHRVRHNLPWAEAMDEHAVPLDVQPFVRRAVLEPVTRYAPGIIALAEIVASTPVVAVRATAPQADWATIANRSKQFGEGLSRDGTDVQVIIRRYLHRSPGETPRPIPQLDSSLLRLDHTAGITPVTPLSDLIMAARNAARAHICPPRGVCLAMLVAGPTEEQAGTQRSLFDAVWGAFVSATARLIFPTIDVDRLEIEPQSVPDGRFRKAIDRLARDRAEELRRRSPGTQGQVRPRNPDETLALETPALRSQ